jgi:uncharacterized protein (DUF58 family)
MSTLEDRLPTVFIIPLMQFFVCILLLIALLYDLRDLTLLALLILGITIGARLWSRFSLKGIRYASRVDKQKLFPGESLILQVSVENAKFLPVWLQMSVPLIDALELSAETTDFAKDCWLLSYQQARFNWKIVARRRGVYRLGSAHMQVGDLFGFFPREKRAAGDMDVIVYPRLVPLKPISLPRRDIFGVPGAKSPVQDPIYILGTRDYQQWRPARHIHWKASARHHRLQEKVFEPSEQEKVLLAVEVSQFEKNQATESFEHSLEIAGTLAVQSHQKGYALGFITNALVEGGPSILPIGRSPQQLSAILEILARLKMRATGALADVLHRVPQLSWGLSCIHFSYKQDEGSRATAQYFSHKGIPMIFIVSGTGARWKQDAQTPGDKTVGIDELVMEAAAQQ